MTGRIPNMQQITRVNWSLLILRGCIIQTPILFSAHEGYQWIEEPNKVVRPPQKKAPGEGKNQTWSIWLLWQRPVGEPKSMKCYGQIVSSKTFLCGFFLGISQVEWWNQLDSLPTCQFLKGGIGGGFENHLKISQNCLVVSTHLKNISQNGNLPQIGVKIQNIWNHHLENPPQTGKTSPYHLGKPLRGIIWPNWATFWGEVVWGRYNLTRTSKLLPIKNTVYQIMKKSLPVFFARTQSCWSCRFDGWHWAPTHVS